MPGDPDGPHGRVTHPRLEPAPIDLLPLAVASAPLSRKSTKSGSGRPDPPLHRKRSCRKEESSFHHRTSSPRRSAERLAVEETIAQSHRQTSNERRPVFACLRPRHGRILVRNQTRNRSRVCNGLLDDLSRSKKTGTSPRIHRCLCWRWNPPFRQDGIGNRRKPADRCQYEAAVQRIPLH